jgi:hypothetical protein
MRRRRQFSIAALMELILYAGVALTLMRLLEDPDISSALLVLASGGLLVVVSASVIYLCLSCIHRVIRLFRRLRFSNVTSRGIRRSDHLTAGLQRGPLRGLEYRLQPESGADPCRPYSAPAASPPVKYARSRCSQSE